MDDEQIRNLLASIEPLKDLLMPIPPNMSALPLDAVVDAGGDPAEVEAWVKQRLGWAKRLPPQFLPPEMGSADREPTVFIIPDKELQGGPRPAPGPRGGPPPVLDDAELVAFVPTKNLTQAKAFYGSMLGLPMEGESPVAVTFDANGTTLRCVLVERFQAYPFTLLGWTVKDVAATVTELTGRGIKFERHEGLEQNELGIWRSPGGAQLAWFKDPFGNMISLTQF